MPPYTTDADLAETPPETFEAQLRVDGDLRNWYAWRGILYFLYEYEEHLTGRRAITKDWTRIMAEDKERSIEHILPQTRRPGEWPEFTDADHRRLVNDLGNLVLMFDNSTYSNKPFVRKRDGDGEAAPGEVGTRCYRTSPMMQEQLVATHDTWTPQVVEDRHDRLVEWALARWAVG